ncbi:hypothetical protein EJD97_023869 [Solanum chilense]|uniref:Uncharacterized protein n=1 Tax=Solanum chilense TaxID=4083 RepID=A0A6N2C253_SOLCI|nr:hypothetical protein EJD97_023869 [Solanum chilense]
MASTSLHLFESLSTELVILIVKRRLHGQLYHSTYMDDESTCRVFHEYFHSIGELRSLIQKRRGGISMRQGLMYIANMKKNMPVIVRRCRHYLRWILNRMWVQEPNLLGVRPIFCTVHQPQQNARRIGWPRGSDDEDDIRCELCIYDLELDYLVKFLPHTTVWE